MIRFIALITLIMIKNLRSILFFVLVCSTAFCFAQKPIISYSTPQVYKKGLAATPLTPVNTGGAVPTSAPITIGTGFSNPTAVAIDGAGNVYVAVNGSNSIAKIPAGGGATVILGSGFLTPTGVAADAAGNVYVADNGNNAVKKIPVDGGAIVNIGSGFVSPYGVALDGSGNLFVSDRGSNTIKKVSVNGGTPVVIASGFNTPTGVAVDAAGNVYVTDRGNNLIKEILTGGTVVTIGTGNGNPNGVAVDAAGNVYFADTNNTSIFKILKADGSVVSVGSGFSLPAGVAVVAGGIVYVDDNGNGAIKEIQPGGYAINKTLPPGLNFDTETGVISGTPTAVSAAANYIVTATNSAGSGTATINISVTLPAKPNIAYNSSQVYTVATDITPITPGNTGGGVPVGGYSVSPSLPAGLSFDINTGNIGGKPLLSHISTNYTVTAANAGGSGSTVINITVNSPAKPNISYGNPQIYTTTIPISELAPINSGGVVPLQTAATFASAVGSVNGLAIDATGNIYVADGDQKAIKKIPAGGGDPVVLASGFINPIGVAVDGSGNIFVADNGSNTIKKVPAGGGAPIAIGAAFNSPYGVATDKAGYIYATDINQIKKISPDGNTTIVLNVSGTITPTALFVDNSGNVYFTDINDNTLKELPVNNTNTITLATGFNHPTGITFDTFGNIYVANANTGQVEKIPVDGGHPIAISSGFNFFIGIAADAVGNIYVADLSNHAVKLINAAGYSITPVLPAGLNFNTTTGIITGTPLKPSPTTDYTVTAYNAGGSNSAIVNLTINHFPYPIISYQSPQVYTVNKAITPALAPSSSQVSPFGNYYSMVAALGLTNLRGAAVDAAGNIYVTEAGLGIVKKIPADGSAPFIIASGFAEPGSVVVDKLGNVYVADNGHNAIKKIPADGTAVTIVASGGHSPYALAIDSYSNLYIANAGDGIIQKAPAGGGPFVTIGPVFSTPFAIAADDSGNVYVADSGTNLIQKIPTGSNTAITLGVASGDPNGIAVDATGNVYVADLNNTSILKISATGVSSFMPVSNLSRPIGLAIDWKGVLYVSDYDTNSVIELIPSGGFFISPALPAGLSFDNNNGFISGTPTAKSPATNYQVTAYNTGSYSSTNVNIKVISIAVLTNLTISSGSLSPAFASSTTNYTARVPNATASIKLTPTATAGDASITVNGTTVGSGAASASLPLNVGDNTIKTVVTASDGISTKTYTLTVTRSTADLSTNALLSSIKLSPSTTLTTVTGPAYKNYTTAVPNGETSLNVISVTQDATATIKVNGITVASGAAQSVPLTVGANIITVTVTAQDGATAKNYIITATRAPSSVATLANLTTSAGGLNPAFAALTTAYTMHVPNATASIKLTPTATAGDASITVNGAAVVSGAASASIPLNVGDNTISTIVTASDGTTIKTYTLTVTRSAAGLSTNALLSSLKINPSTTITTVTGPGYKNYTTAVPNGETSLSVTSVVQDATAVIRVNGTTVASGAASPSLPLSVGVNVITIAVTAQDGATVKNYILTATRASSSIATLSNLITSSGTLDPVFGSLTTAYTAYVSNATASIKLTPTATADDASIKVNGTAVLSGAASASLPLTVGNNIITTVVAASDGITTKTYTLTVVRSAAGLSTNALLSSIKLSPSTTITTVTGPGYKNYTTAVPNSETSLKVTSVAQDATATIKVNGTAVASGVASPSIPLAVGSTVINIVVTAQDGATTKNYIITTTRAGSVQSLVLLNESPDSLKTTDGVIVHPGVSPNGDGISDYLVIDGLDAYPGNKLTIMDRSGVTVFAANNYGSKVFDGHSSVNGSMQLPGTYFYLLEYNNGKENKRKTGFILLKY